MGHIVRVHNERGVLVLYSTCHLCRMKPLEVTAALSPLLEGRSLYLNSTSGTDFTASLTTSEGSTLKIL